MNAVVIDDEKYCTDVLTILLGKHCQEVNVVAVFNQATAALDYLKSHQVDIIFLDIEMPQMNGFELLFQLGNVSSMVFFTTAYDQYSLDIGRGPTNVQVWNVPAVVIGDQSGTGFPTVRQYP